jgi:hypothetical protein
MRDKSSTGTGSYSAENNSLPRWNEPSVRFIIAVSVIFSYSPKTKKIFLH